MDQADRRLFLLKRLIGEQRRYRDLEIPADTDGQKRLLRSLMNVRMPMEIDGDFLSVQDEYLQKETAQKGITRLEDLKPVENGIYLWQGDITTLRCDAIVNAANSGLTGCYIPCHNCIDNCIHTWAGIQLRLECDGLMKAQGHGEETGRAKLTGAYNLPCRYILHTVGPIVSGPLTERDKRLLASCYTSCLELAEKNGIGSIAFCCISTGEFHFPNEKAAEIAVRTVRDHRERSGSDIKVIFNVFKETDYEIYRNLLGAD